MYDGKTCGMELRANDNEVEGLVFSLRCEKSFYFSSGKGFYLDLHKIPG